MPRCKRHCEDCGRPSRLRPLSFVKVTRPDLEPEFAWAEYMTLCKPCLNERKRYAGKRPDHMTIEEA